MTSQQLISKSLISQTVPIKLTLAYIVYLIEYAQANKN